MIDEPQLASNKFDCASLLLDDTKKTLVQKNRPVCSAEHDTSAEQVCRISEWKVRRKHVCLYVTNTFSVEIQYESNV